MRIRVSLYINFVVPDTDFLAHIVRLAARYTPPPAAASPANPPIVAPVTTPISRVSVFVWFDMEVIGAVTILIVAVDSVEFWRLGNVFSFFGVQVSVLSSVDVAVTSSVVAMATAVDITEFLRRFGELDSVFASAEVLRMLIGVSVIIGDIGLEFVFVKVVLRVDTGTCTVFEAVVELSVLGLSVTKTE